MNNKVYTKQAALLVNILPEVAKEQCFALYGGTAINLFVRDLPRLSVDVDLTYLPIEDRQCSLDNIAKALERIKDRIKQHLTIVNVLHKREIGKLLVSSHGISIKVEVNLVARGVLAQPDIMPLCKQAQEEFDVFCAMPIVPVGQLYGGKICAALDRQHPRDLFDVKYLLKNEGFSNDIKNGFLFCLLSSDRPIHEMINPNFQNQRRAMENQFYGMSRKPFSYDEYESSRRDLVALIQKNLTQQDNEFLYSVKTLVPDWTLYDFERFPAVQWKLHNIQKLKDANPKKYQSQCEALKNILDSW